MKKKPTNHPGEIMRQKEAMFLNYIKQAYHQAITLVDAGANRGLYTQAFCKLIPCKKVHLFEPIPRMYDIMSKRLPGGNVYKKYNVALGSENTVTTFYHCKEHPHLSSFVNRPIFYRNGNSPDVIDIKVCKLQDIVRDEHIEVLKIDTEGYELEVLRGCDELLENKKVDYIQFEYGGCFKESGVKLNDVVSFLHDYNYVVCDIFETGFEQVKNIEAMDNGRLKNFYVKRGDL